ncbi:hypothetical protein CDO81_13945 [Roseateles puraquae]|uniref:Uncharacterized protein n=1 Tax=Roseateles puraquae TaxID=431059 RepID=A0A254N6E0_9BURK|nr:hypothetical protein CDO81_13945 [Roseateles puraquae]
MRAIFMAGGFRANLEVGEGPGGGSQRAPVAGRHARGEIPARAPDGRVRTAAWPTAHPGLEVQTLA